MQATIPSLPQLLKKYGRFSFDQARRSGLSQFEIAKLVASGVINKISRGIYELVSAELDPSTRDFSIACFKFGPTATIGGLTALFHYTLIQQVPGQTWVLVPPSKYSADSIYRLVRTKNSLTIGVEQQPTYRITSIERTIVDAFLLSTKLGEGIAYSAAIRGIRNRQTSPIKIFKMAQLLGVKSRIEQHSQALLGALEA